MKNKLLAIVGPYPPPFGGISVHIQRLERFLKKYTIPYVIYNHYYTSNENVIALNKSKFWYFKFLFNRRHQLVHFHQFSFFHFPYYFLYSIINRTNMIITIHNEKIFSYSSWIQRIVYWLLRKTKYKHLICVSKNLSDHLQKNQINNLFLPAYVPAPEVPQKKLLLPENKISFLFSVWKLDKNTSENIYNIPLILQFLQKNKDRFFMVLMIGNRQETDEVYLNQLLDQFELKINEDLMILYDLPLTPYFKNFAFLVRTNTSDGYGISLQEAIDAGIPAIASDVCLRPNGTILFKSDDISDLEKKIFSIVNNPSIINKKINPTTHLKLLDIYMDLLSLKKEQEIKKR